MAKGVHSKRRKKNKSLQRRAIYEQIGKEIDKATHQRLLKRTFGSGDDSYITRKKNAFLFPKDPEAIFPQADKPLYIEKRAAYLPMHLRTKKKGIKAYKLEEQRQKQEIQDAINKAEEEFEKNTNKHKATRDMNIDLSSSLNNLTSLDKELERLNVSEKSKENKSKKTTNRDKKKKKSKMHYIANH